MICNQCGNEKHFKDKRNRKYCSDSCGYKAFKDSHGRPSEFPHLSPGNVGSLNELKTCCDLMEKGYHVFKAVHQNSPCDLVAMRDDKLYRIEVKTGYVKDGEFHCAISRNNAYDVLAVVDKGIVHYFPNIV